MNLFGTVIPTTVFGRVMAGQGTGSIVNISSLTAQRPLTRVMGYTLAKTAIEGYTRWMATELGLRYGGGVRMNAIAPGVFLTEQNRDLLIAADGSHTDRANKFITHTPFGRFGQPEELTGTLIYLLSNASRFVNGETVVVDGGFNAFSGVLIDSTVKRYEQRCGTDMTCPTLFPLQCPSSKAGAGTAPTTP